MLMPTESIPAIDVHAHYGTYDSGKPDFVNELMTGDNHVVADRARKANIRLTIVSPLAALLPRGGGNPVSGNRHAARVVPETPGLLQYVVIDPREPETFVQAEEMLQQLTCVGIKIHPEEHVYPINDYGEAIFAFAARHRAVVLSHSSERNSLASDLVAWANRFPEMKLILAHIGCGWDGDYTHQVRGIQESRHGNVFADTSSARSITPKLIEWAAGQIGADRVLFGTDAPLYETCMQRIRIDQANLKDAEKEQILHINAERLFGLPSQADEFPVGAPSSNSPQDNQERLRKKPD
jgi:predicted TIM-barrel fold metal-dependent hydrolase